MTARTNFEKAAVTPSQQRSDIDIARAADIRPIADIGAALGVPWEAMVPYGHTKAKIGLDYIDSLADRPDGKLILVTGITPTPPGEGKTTTTVGLCDALNRLGSRAAACLREPSLGPCFGMKGGAAGGGQAQVIPMEDINLHFTGDLHAIGMAHNLLSALIDNHIHWGNALGIDPRRITWRRVMDMNERALREIVVGLGSGNGMPREDGFDITAASEIMAILCLANDLDDLQQRLGRIVVAETFERTPVTAAELDADGAMTVLLKDALMPNLVQTLENNPAFIHGGPFANIAHGCNSVMATKTALKLADYVVTEAGFGADLGAEKFFDIKCRKTGMQPAGAVVVATVRALKMHGGVALKDLKTENVAAVRAGCVNLARHLRNIKLFGVPPIVAINRFDTDTDAELSAIREAGLAHGAETVICTHHADGGRGAEELARRVVALVGRGEARFKPLYEDDLSLWDKVRTIATRLYDADDIVADKKIVQRFKALEKAGFGHFPVCIAKTQYSFSTDPTLRGAPSHHTLPIREVRLSAGAEFVVVVCGEIMTMPGLPRTPAATDMGIGAKGEVRGLF
ncbi:formate--tetrahydrofolate ligase [Salinisphaera aquimarina]|uniref:Formate--tetrahydrofolate ligase n=1 Tax=Salinisphaera aquimarina TaxID=2094031 RepID=A0ABV7EUS7_9GAMM